MGERPAPAFLRLTWTVKPVGSYVPCSVCKLAHHKCDGKRPCGRCVRLQRASECLDPPSRKRGRPTIEIFDDSLESRDKTETPLRVISPDDSVVPLPLNPTRLKLSFDAERCTDVSEAWLRMMEFARPEHVVGVPWFQFLPPAVVPLAVAEWHALERSFADAVKRSYVLEMQSVGHTQSGRIVRTRCMHHIELDEQRRVKASHIEIVDLFFIPTIALHPPKMWKVVEEGASPQSSADDLASSVSSFDTSRSHSPLPDDSTQLQAPLPHSHPASLARLAATLSGASPPGEMRITAASQMHSSVPAAAELPPVAATDLLFEDQPIVPLPYTATPPHEPWPLLTRSNFDFAYAPPAPNGSQSGLPWVRI